MEIATQMGVSSNYLSTIFRRETQYSINEYLNAVRLNHAKKFLRDTNLKVYEIAEKTGFSKKDTEMTINAALETIVQALEENEKVQLVGFGSFEVKQRAARIGRNPKTKEAIEIPASKAPVFKPSKALKDVLAK